MKANIYYIFLIFLLQFGGNHLFVDTHKSDTSTSFSKNATKHLNLEHKNSNQHTSLEVIIDFDFEEEFHTSENLEERDSDKLLADTNGFLNNWYLSFFKAFIYSDYSNNFISFTPFSVHSNPIYLIIGDFRI